MQLKADMHIHVKGDPVDKWIVHTPQQLVDHCKKIGIRVIAITCHRKVVYPQGIAEYGKKRGIVVVKGCEAVVEGCHTLLYNFTQEEVDQVKSFEHLRRLKREDQCVVAPHPYYPHPWKYVNEHGGSMGDKLVENIDLFDAIETSFFYTRFLNMNKKAEQVAKKYNKPVVANSDSHVLSHIGRNVHTLIKLNRMTQKDVLDAIKKGNVTAVTKPLTLAKFTQMGIWTLTPNSLKKRLV